MSVLPVLVLVPFCPGLEPRPNGLVFNLKFRISVPYFPSKRESPLQSQPFFAHAAQSSRLVCCPPASGRRPDAFRVPRAPGRVRRPHSQRLRRRRSRLRAPLVVSLPHSFSPSGMERAMLARPRLPRRRSWRSRLLPRGPLRHTPAGLTALPWSLGGDCLRR